MSNRKRGKTRLVTQIASFGNLVYRGQFIVVFEDPVAPDYQYILTKENYPHVLAHTTPEGLIIWHKATSEEGNRPYRRLQDDILFWQNCDPERIKEKLRANHLTSKEALDGITEEIYYICNSVRPSTDEQSQHQGRLS